jgi:hypothetical protein
MPPPHHPIDHMIGGVVRSSSVDGMVWGAVQYVQNVQKDFFVCGILNNLNVSNIGSCFKKGSHLSCFEHFEQR